MTSFGKRRLYLSMSMALIVAAALLFILNGLSSAQQVSPALRITSPADGTVVAPGQTIAIVVTPAPNISPVGVFLIGRDPIGFVNGTQAPPFVFTITLPKDTAPGQYQLRAYGSIPPGVQVKSRSITFDVEKSEPL